MRLFNRLVGVLRGVVKHVVKQESGIRGRGHGLCAVAYALAVVVAASPAMATPLPITDLFNTGVDASGNLIATGASDTHWSVVGSPTISGTANFYNGAAKAYAINEWNPANNLPANQSISQWITPPNASPTVVFTPLGTPVNCFAGTFIYQSTFTMPSSFESALITGRFACDNNSPGLLLNGVGATVGSVDADKFLTFTFTSGFQAGLNTLQFYVYNDPGTAEPNPTGIQIQLTGTYAVPEPSSAVLALLGVGLAGVAACRRRAVRG